MSKNKYTNPLFEKFKKSQENNASGGGGNRFGDILKTPAGNTFVVRFVPNLDDMDKTMYPFYQHGWRDEESGRYQTVTCPSTHGEPCPICAERFRIGDLAKATGDSDMDAIGRSLSRKAQYYANVYVVSDPVNPDNEGTIKILRFGNQINDIIKEATLGDDAEEFGGRIIDMSDEGCNFRIKVVKGTNGYPGYEHSKFLNPSSIGVDVDDVQKELKSFDELFNNKTTDELVEFIETCPGYAEYKVAGSTPVTTSEESVKEDDPVSVSELDDFDDIMKDL